MWINITSTKQGWIRGWIYLYTYLLFNSSNPTDWSVSFYFPVNLTRMSDSEFIKKMLRSVLQSSKAGVSMSDLQSDYRSLCGERIPLQALGFSKLEDYLKSIPSVVRLQQLHMGDVRDRSFFIYPSIRPTKKLHKKLFDFHHICERHHFFFNRTISLAL